MATTGVLDPAAGTDLAIQRGDNFGFGTSGALIYCIAAAAGSGRYNGGFRFTSLGIPSGATITAVNITVTPQNTSYDDINCIVLVEDQASPPTFDTTNTVNNRTYYGTTSSWTAASLGTSRATVTGSTTDTNLLSMFQHLVDTNGGITDVVIQLQGQTSAPFYGYRINSWTAGSTYWPQLEVTYTTGATDLSISKSDTITVSESVGRLLTSNRSVSDTVTITENAKSTLVNNVNVNDTIISLDGYKSLFYDGFEAGLGLWTQAGSTITNDASVFYACLLYTSPSPRD